MRGLSGGLTPPPEGGRPVAVMHVSYAGGIFKYACVIEAICTCHMYLSYHSANANHYH